APALQDQWGCALGLWGECEYQPTVNQTGADSPALDRESQRGLQGSDCSLRSTSSAVMTPTRTPLPSTTKSRCLFSASISPITLLAGVWGVTEKTAGVIKSRTRVGAIFPP